MRKNGFTLIELLAVIVILAIIALIATPIILGIINDAREESNERSVELYASAVRNGIAAYQLRTGNEVLPGTYNETNKLPFEVEYDGKVDCTSVIISEDGKVSLEGCTVNGGEKTYNYGLEEERDVVKLCTANTTKATALVYDGENDTYDETSYAREEVGLLASESGLYTPGVTYTCNFVDDSETNNMTFFVLSSTEDDVTLIAGFDLVASPWSDDGLNHIDESEDKQAVTAKAALADRTSTWGKLTDVQKVTIKLPTADQIESVYEGTMPTWLYSYIIEPASYGYGYWTSTPADDPEYTNSAIAMFMEGGLSFYFVTSEDIGVRPVITLSKDAIN